MFMVWCGVCVYMCQGVHVEVREHLAEVSTLLMPCSILWIELESSDLCREYFITEPSHQPSDSLFYLNSIGSVLRETPPLRAVALLPWPLGLSFSFSPFFFQKLCFINAY